MTQNIQPPLRGYKVADPQGKCRGFQFEAGKEYKHDGAIKICGSGFHFCIKPAHCFSYYSFDSSNMVFEVEAIGQYQTHDEDSKVCTDHIRIVRQLTWQEVLQAVNEGKDNTGLSNTGYSNTGNRNTGNWNTGNRNTGDWNTGNRNTGDWNTGNRNTGYSNTGNRNTGAFCTEDAPFPLFNKPSTISESDFKNTRAYYLMSRYIETKMWVSRSNMTEEEVKAHPSCDTVDGYLKDIPFKEAFQNAWHNWNAENRTAFTTLPNFDADVFFQITGIRVA